MTIREQRTECIQIDELLYVAETVLHLQYKNPCLVVVQFLVNLV